MIFSKNSRKAPHLLSLLVAFAVAVGMWYVVSVRDRLEVQLEVGIEYNGIPSGLVVTDGLVSKVQVRLRGPEILLRSISSRSLTEAINLSNIKKGTTIVPLTSDKCVPDHGGNCIRKPRRHRKEAPDRLCSDNGGHYCHCCRSEL